MASKITLVILLCLLIFMVGFLSYIFISYVKENIVLIRNLDAKLLGRVLLYRPKLLVLFIFGLLMTGWAINELWNSAWTNWRKTEATLSDIVLDERTVNNKPEEFLRVVYEFQVDENTYEAYDDIARYSFMTVERQMEEVRSVFRTRKIFYNQTNPYQVHFYESDTSILKYIGALFCAFFAILFSYWLTMEVYKSEKTNQ